MENINFALMKNTNRFEVINRIYREDDVNRNYLTQNTGLTGAAVTKIINGLTADGFISEKAYYSDLRGRRARYLSIRQNRYCVIVLYLNRDSTTSTVTDISGNFFFSQSFQMNWKMFDEFAIQEIIREAASHIPPQSTCIGVVCITPGIRSTDAQFVEKEAPYFWNIQKVRDLVQREFRLPFFTENDSNAALLGEMWFGKGRDSNNVVLYNIGKGIGAAAFLHGVLLRGYHNSSIEIGHVSINFQGPVCACGNRGCLELYTGLDNLKGKVEAFDTRYGTDDTIESIFVKARGGNENCKKFVKEYASLIATGAVILAEMFSPEKIIITTNEAEFIDLTSIVDSTKDAINTRIFSLGKQNIKIEASNLRKDGYILGGISVAMQNYFCIGS
ncbi:MAG: ROK family transcriptional regulator [Sphaerochaetaceae bacterium]